MLVDNGVFVGVVWILRYRDDQWAEARQPSEFLDVSRGPWSELISLTVGGRGE